MGFHIYPFSPAWADTSPDFGLNPDCIGPTPHLFGSGGWQRNCHLSSGTTVVQTPCFENPINFLKHVGLHPQQVVWGKYGPLKFHYWPYTAKPKCHITLTLPAPTASHWKTALDEALAHLRQFNDLVTIKIKPEPPALECSIPSHLLTYIENLVTKRWNYLDDFRTAVYNGLMEVEGSKAQAYPLCRELFDQWVAPLQAALKQTVVDIRETFFTLLQMASPTNARAVDLKQQIHDLGNYLTGGISHIELLAEQVKMGKPVDIRRLLPPNDIAGIAHRVGLGLQKAAREKKVTVESNIDPEVSLLRPRTKEFRRFLDRILTNFIGNAVKYHYDASQADPEIESYARLWAFAEGDFILFSIEDNGPGVSEEELPRLGQDGFRSKEAVTRGLPGTGTGLSGAYDLIRRLGGTVEPATKTTGGGLTIEFTLPRHHFYDINEENPPLEPAAANTLSAPQQNPVHNGVVIGNGCVTLPSAATRPSSPKVARLQDFTPRVITTHNGAVTHATLSSLKRPTSYWYSNPLAHGGLRAVRFPTLRLVMAGMSK